MEKSKSLAGLVGPTLVVMVISELKVWNPTLYDSQIVPLVYISGVLLFVAGLSIIRHHSIWVLGWQTSITMVGWFSIFLGLTRMFFPSIYKAKFKNGHIALLVEILLIFLGIFLTWKPYMPQKKI